MRVLCCFSKKFPKDKKQNQTKNQTQEWEKAIRKQKKTNYIIAYILHVN